MDPDDEYYIVWSGWNPNMYEGGFDEDGCPHGVHPWSKPRPRGFYWAVLREHLRHEQLALYWYKRIHVPTSDGSAPPTHQQAFAADFGHVSP